MATHGLAFQQLAPAGKHALLAKARRHAAAEQRSNAEEIRRLEMEQRQWQREVDADIRRGDKPNLLSMGRLNEEEVRRAVDFLNSEECQDQTLGPHIGAFGEVPKGLSAWQVALFLDAVEPLLPKKPEPLKWWARAMSENR